MAKQASESSSVLGDVLKLLLWLAGAFLLVPVMCVGGCLAVGVAGGTRDAIVDVIAKRQFYEAVNSPLPDDVDVIVSGEWGALIELMRSSPPLTGLLVAQNQSATYGLTYQGLFDFATGRHTDLNCTAEETSQTKWRRDAYWIGDDSFYWKGCAFSVDDLRPGRYENAHCFRCSLEWAREVLSPILPDTTAVYYPEGYDGYYYFVVRQPDQPVAVHTVVLAEEAGRVLMSDVSFPTIVLPRASLERDYYLGRSIAAGERHLSPDGQLEATFDGQTLTVRHNADKNVVAIVRADEFHTASREPALYPKDWHKMSVYGWTDDGKQILFSVETALSHAGGSIRLGAIKQVFVLNIP